MLQFQHASVFKGRGGGEGGRRTVPPARGHLAALQRVPLAPDAHPLVRLEAPEDLGGLRQRCQHIT